MTLATPDGQSIPFYKGGYSITAVAFPSRLLGVAVGTGCSSFAQYTDPDYGFTTGISTGTVATSYIPKVLTTFDQGASWQARTNSPELRHGIFPAILRASPSALLCPRRSSLASPLPPSLLPRPSSTPRVLLEPPSSPPRTRPPRT